MVALVVVGLGLALGLASGGRIADLNRFRMTGERLIVPCFILQSVFRGRDFGLSGMPMVAVAVWTGASVILVILLILNHRIPGCYVAATGALLNLLVVLANGGMPVGPRPGAASAAVLVDGAQSFFYVVRGPATIVGFAGDVISLAVGDAWMMFSIGDVLLGVGVCVAIVYAIRGRVISLEPK